MNPWTDTRFRTVAEARAEAARHDAFLARTTTPPTREELDREAVTNRLREEFLRVDIRVLDELSRTHCRRDLPLPGWRARR